MDGTSLVKVGIFPSIGAGGGTEAEVTDLESVFSDLVRVETRLWNLVEMRLRAEHDLTLGRFETMSVIGRRGRCRPYDIAGDLGITVSGASKLIDRIEAAGHCTRTANPADGRSLLVELTTTGGVLLGQARITVRDVLSEHVTSALSPPAVQQLSASLADLRSAIYACDDATGARQ
ncbi:MAG: MarR family winged helix-turn-helix transcriptional regulator [Nakamurella sp.]